MTAATIAPRATPAPVAHPSARPAYPDGEKRGWFDFGNRTPTNG